MSTTLYRDGALADARSDRLRVGMSILVEDGVIRWIRPRDGEEDPGPRGGLELVDASGATFVPGMVDAHSHLTLPGGAHWLDRADDDPAALLEVAEGNGRLLTQAGVRWARDVGAPFVDDPTVGRRAGAQPRRPRPLAGSSGLPVCPCRRHLADSDAGRCPARSIGARPRTRTSSWRSRPSSSMTARTC